MFHSTDLTARETEIIRILRVLGEATSGFVVIGGYAVSALGQHRFSVDCDLATHEDYISVLDKALNRDGYNWKKNVRRLPPGVVTREYVKPIGKASVSVELLVNTVVSRGTLGTWTYRFIRENSVEAIVVGVTDSTLSRVAGRNLLAAMKLHAGRTQDIGDVVVLSQEIDWETVAKFAACGSKGEVARRIELAASEISSQKFASDFKSAFAMRGDVTSLIERAKRGLDELKTLIGEQKFNDSL